MIGDNPKNLVIIGGSFDPPTIAHIELGRIARENVDNAEIVYIPASKKYVDSKHKDDNGLLSDEERLFILDKCISNYRLGKVSDIEINKVVSGYTIDTLEYFNKTGVYDNIYVVIGRDKILELPTWKNFNKIMEMSNVKFLLMPRDSMDKYSAEELAVLNLDKDKFIRVNVKSDFMSVSATKARNAVRNHNTQILKELVPASVYMYLKEGIDNEKF